MLAYFQAMMEGGLFMVFLLLRCVHNRSCGSRKKMAKLITIITPVERFLLSPWQWRANGSGVCYYVQGLAVYFVAGIYL